MKLLESDFHFILLKFPKEQLVAVRVDWGVGYSEGSVAFCTRQYYNFTFHESTILESDYKKILSSDYLRCYTRLHQMYQITTYNTRFFFQFSDIKSLIPILFLNPNLKSCLITLVVPNIKQSVWYNSCPEFIVGYHLSTWSRKKIVLIAIMVEWNFFFWSESTPSFALLGSIGGLKEQETLTARK